MARVRRRDVRAFEALYDDYHRLVYSVALRVLTDREAAEDVTQSVFMKLWSDPDAFISGNFGAWVVRVARNRAFDVLRTRAARPESEIPESLPTGDSIEDATFSQLDARSLRDAVDRLPVEQRDLIELGFFGGITHQEMARRTGLPLGTIKTRIRTGLRRLRNALDGVITV